MRAKEPTKIYTELKKAPIRNDSYLWNGLVRIQVHFLELKSEGQTFLRFLNKTYWVNFYIRAYKGLCPKLLWH